MTIIPNIFNLDNLQGFIDSDHVYHSLLEWYTDRYDPNTDTYTLVIFLYYTAGEGLDACAFNIDPLGNLIDCDLIFV